MRGAPCEGLKADSRRLGRWGETLAREFLEDRGVTRLRANVIVNGGEIDLVGDVGGTPTAFEVKTVVERRPGDHADLLVTDVKLRRVRSLATSLRPPVGRVDAVTVTVGESGVQVRWSARVG